MFFSYDYETLLAEFIQDVNDGYFPRNAVYIEREELADYDYRPIVDWYYNLSNVPKNVVVEKTTPQKVLEEMMKYNSLLGIYVDDDDISPFS